jgi:7-keto-8-aminopelargonate synthetase-like enzyme
LMKNVLHLRNELQKMGLEVIGNPSAIVSAKVGDEALARMVSQRLPELGVVANLVEFPAVAKGSARFRLQVMAKHTKENIDALIARLKIALMAAQGSYQAYRLLVTEAAQAEAQSEPEQARRSA